MKIIDLHCDTIELLMQDKEKLNLQRNHFCVDIEKLRKGNSIAQFFALFVDKGEVSDPLNHCLEMLDKFYHELSLSSNDIAFAKNYNDLIKNMESGKISAFLTIEEGGVIKGELHNLRNMHRLGVRLMTLTWNYPNEIGYPNSNYTYKDRGLTTFGKEVVNEMNQLGMLIDVSHLSDKGFWDVAKLSKSPFIASHSNARSITNHSRNLTDEMIRAISNSGGIIGINFGKAFLGDSDISQVKDMVKHIKHIYQVGGIDVISVGSDFDGVSPEIEIRDISEISKLVFSLEKDGFSQNEIEKICSGNALRIIKEVLR